MTIEIYHFMFGSVHIVADAEAYFCSINNQYPNANIVVSTVGSSERGIVCSSLRFVESTRLPGQQLKER